MRFALFCILLMIISRPLLSLNEENHNISHQEEALAIEQADRRLQHLNEKIERFLDQRSATLKDNEEFLKEIGDWERAVRDDIAFGEKIQKLQKAFLVFQDCLSQVVIGNYGSCPYSRTLRSSSILNLTEWYANHMEKVILPENSPSKDKKD